MLTFKVYEHDDKDVLYTMMRKAFEEPAARPLFYEKLLEMEIYALYCGEAPQKETEYFAKENTQITFRAFDNGAIPIFSSKNRMYDENSPLKKSKEKITYIALKGRDIFTSCKNAKFVINVWSLYWKEFSPEEVGLILRGENLSEIDRFWIRNYERI
ncbi:MAG: SseB family protein [Endomicrobium sp.]|jgi:hypothetical protein|nr:SseB family protein [Endomicrobium sp.]